jgi:hypothetical protein
MKYEHCRRLYNYLLVMYALKVYRKATHQSEESFLKLLGITEDSITPLLGYTISEEKRPILDLMISNSPHLPALLKVYQIRENQK